MSGCSIFVQCPDIVSLHSFLELCPGTVSWCGVPTSSLDTMFWQHLGAACSLRALEKCRPRAVSCRNPGKTPLPQTTTKKPSEKTKNEQKNPFPRNTHSPTKNPFLAHPPVTKKTTFSNTPPPTAGQKTLQHKKPYFATTSTSATK